ncbi:MAG: hypothetical protein RLZZ524_3138 [Pseudomonadota bacterium]|jgi:transcriptional regulator with XRE-family HTH domain
MSEDLDAEVRSLLMDRKGEWKRIADVSNVSYSWISKFVNGHIPNPGFSTLRDLQKSLKKETNTAAILREAA